MRQRTEMKKFEAGAGLKTSLTDQKIEHLEDMGFQWSVKKEREDAMWNQRFEELREFKEEHGHCRVTRKLSRKLGNWVENQRHNKRVIAGRTEVKAVKLQAMGFFDS